MGRKVWSLCRRVISSVLFSTLMCYPANNFCQDVHRQPSHAKETLSASDVAQLRRKCNRGAKNDPNSGLTAIVYSA